MYFSLTSIAQLVNGHLWPLWTRVRFPSDTKIFFSLSFLLVNWGVSGPLTCSCLAFGLVHLGQHVLNWSCQNDKKKVDFLHVSLTFFNANSILQQGHFYPNGIRKNLRARRKVKRAFFSPLGSASGEKQPPLGGKVKITAWDKGGPG